MCSMDNRRFGHANLSSPGCIQQVIRSLTYIPEPPQCRAYLIFSHILVSSDPMRKPEPESRSLVANHILQIMRKLRMFYAVFEALYM